MNLLLAQTLKLKWMEMAKAVVKLMLLKAW